MDSSVSQKDEIWFLRVRRHISTGLYLFQDGVHWWGLKETLMVLRLKNVEGFLD
jgi:hypothetical protein